MSDPRSDSEVDYLDDEADDEFLPLDTEEARELGVDLDDPEELAAEEDEPGV